jgi:hypothetical protein
MGQKLTITESERKRIIDLYEQSIQAKQDVSNLFTSEEMEYSGNVYLKKDHFNNDIYISTDGPLEISKSIQGGNMSYNLFIKVRADITPLKGIYIMFSDGTRINKPNGHVYRDYERRPLLIGLLNNLTPNEINLFKTKSIKYVKVGDVEDDLSEYSNDLKLGLSILLKINRQNFDSVEKLFDEKKYNASRYDIPTPETKEAPTLPIDADFPGGDSSLSRYINKLINKTLIKQNQPTKTNFDVEVLLTVSKDGIVKSVDISKDPGFGIKDELIRLLMKSPKWKPGFVNGKISETTFKKVINITLDE